LLHCTSVSLLHSTAGVVIAGASADPATTGLAAFDSGITSEANGPATLSSWVCSSPSRRPVTAGVGRVVVLVVIGGSALLDAYDVRPAAQLLVGVAGIVIVALGIAALLRLLR